MHLTVADVDRSVAWYNRALGLRIHSHEPGTAELGDGVETVIVLHEDGLAQPAGRTAGLFHFALLYPSRKELARAAVRLAATGTPSRGRPTTARTRRCTWPMSTATASSSPLTVLASSGRPASATTVAPRRWTSTRCWAPSRATS